MVALNRDGDDLESDEGHDLESDLEGTYRGEHESETWYTRLLVSECSERYAIM